MFIEGRASLVALRQEGHVDPLRTDFIAHIALLTEGDNASHLLL